MSSIKISKTEILHLLILFVNPFLSVVLASWFLLWRHKVNMLALSVALSSIFIYLPLAADTASNFFAYLSFSNVEEAFFNRGLYLAIIKYLNECCNLQYMTVVFFSLILTMFIWFKVFEYFSEKSRDYASYSYMLFFVIFSLVELRMMGLNRNYLAITLLFLFIFWKDIKLYKNIWIYLLVVIAIFIHPSVLLLILLYFFAKIFHNIKIYLLGFIFASIGAFLMFPMLEYISTLLLKLNQPILSYTLDYYIHSPIHGYIAMFGFYLKIRVIEIPFLFILYYMGIQLMIDNNSVWIRFILLLILTTLLFFFMHSLYERYSIATYIFASLIVYYYILEKGTRNFVLPLLTVLLIVRFLYLNIMNYGYIYSDNGYIKVLPNHSKKVEMMIKPAYIPLLFLLDIKENGYSDEYISSVTQYSGEVLH